MKSVITALAVFISFVIYGQARIITGRVMDENGNPIPFACITVKGTVRGNGTNTDSNGVFSLSKIYYSDTLICSHVNYQPNKEAVKGNRQITFFLSLKIPESTLIAIVSFPYYTTPTIVKTKIQDTLIKNGLQVDYEPAFTKVEIPAFFGKDSNDLKRYFKRSIIFSDKTDLLDFEGFVVARFKVGKNGKANNPIIVKSLNDVCDSIVISAINKMPLWEQPAEQNGRIIESMREVSVYFKIEARGTRGY